MTTEKKEKVTLRDCLAAILTTYDMLENDGNVTEDIRSDLEEIIQRLTIPQYLQACADAAYDRPSAYWSLCAREKIEGDIPELTMHARSRKYGWTGDDPESLEHMRKHFKPEDLRPLMSGIWST